MYNGIGLETPRGSGTNGFVQRNMAFVRPRKEKVDYRTEEELAKSEASLNREPNLEILEHERKRKIEIDCLELREMLEVQNFDEKEIEEKVDAFRATQLKKLKSENAGIPLDESGRPIASGTHEIAAANQTRNKKLREAFGISAEYVDGSSMDPARHQRELDARSKRYALIKDPEDDLITASSAKSESAKPQPDIREMPAKARKVRSPSVQSSSTGSESGNEASYSEGEIRSNDKKDRRARHARNGTSTNQLQNSPQRKQDSSPSRRRRSSRDRERSDRRDAGKRREERRQSPEQRRSPSPKRRRRSPGREDRRRGNDDRKERRRASPVRVKSRSPRSRREEQSKRSPLKRMTSASSDDSSVERQRRRVERERRKKDGHASPSSSSSSSPSPRRSVSGERKRGNGMDRRLSGSRGRNKK